MHTYTLGALFVALVPTVRSQDAYFIADTYTGFDFLDLWDWETLDDPTNGRVNFVDQDTALARNLSYANNDKFIMRADDQNVVQKDQRGRDSNRITSKLAYAESIICLDLEHMPGGCAQWPAFWSLSQEGRWPNGGEIDIIEGVNVNNHNLASLHTTQNCSMAQFRNQRGNTISTDCDSSVNYNQGCGTAFTESNSFGQGFNGGAGGWYVMQRSQDIGVKIWFWARNDPSVPNTIRLGYPFVSPDDSWGTPDASFPPTTCDQKSHFDAHRMVFDLTFCGDWAGAAFSDSGCSTSTCDNFVDNNPSAFSEAYWEINSLRPGSIRA